MFRLLRAARAADEIGGLLTLQPEQPVTSRSMLFSNCPICCPKPLSSPACIKAIRIEVFANVRSNLIIPAGDEIYGTVQREFELRNFHPLTGAPRCPRAERSSLERTYFILQRCPAHRVAETFKSFGNFGRRYRLGTCLGQSQYFNAQQQYPAEIGYVVDLSGCHRMFRLCALCIDQRHDARGRRPRL